MRRDSLTARIASCLFFFFQAEDGIRDYKVTGVQTCALPICRVSRPPNIGQFVRLLNELSGDLSPKQTMQMGRQVAELLVESYTARSLAAPTWVHDLRRHYESPGAPTGDVA